MADDVSNTTLAILLVLTIIISVGGTWTVFDAAKQQRSITAFAVSNNTHFGPGRIELIVVGEEQPNATEMSDVLANFSN